MLIRGAELLGVPGSRDVRIEGERIAAVADRLEPRPGEPRIDAAGGALLPGLHDHHLHLFALAAALESLPCGPPRVRDARELGRALAAAEPDADGWLRGVGYHESVAGELDRRALDAWTGARPTRIQHRSGAQWILNSAGLAALGVLPDHGDLPPGLERDGRGRATGRLLREDAWLRARLGARRAPDLAPVGRRLARLGVTAATDATPGNAAAELARFVEAALRGALPQRLVVMGGRKLPPVRHPRVERGALKLMLAESDLPRLDELEARIAEAHADGRAVAVHCVTRTELVFACSAFAAAGCRAGDRIEHASLCDPACAELVAALPLTVVTQPNFVCERGDAYRRDVDAADRPWLYRGRGFLDAGIPLAAGTDAPFGEPDPWSAMRAAVERRTREGILLGAGEALDPETALGLFADRPGAPLRRLEAGGAADLCLLDRPWRAARGALEGGHVRATWARGRLAWLADDPSRAEVPAPAGR